MNLDWGPVLTLGAFIVGFIVYTIRQEGRISSVEIKQEGRVSAIEKLIEIKLGEAAEKIKELEDGQRRIVETRDVLYRKVMDELGTVNKCLARIEGRLAYEDDQKN